MVDCVLHHRRRIPRRQAVSSDAKEKLPQYMTGFPPLPRCVSSRSREERKLTTYWWFFCLSTINFLLIYSVLSSILYVS